MYYMSVSLTNTPLWRDMAVFSVTARIPGDVTLVPCDSQVYPDGIKAVIVDSSATGSPRYFELCGNADYDLVLSVEQCSAGTPLAALYACADDNSCAAILPSVTSWGYFSDGFQSCVHSWTKTSGRKDTCAPLPTGASGPSVHLPRRAGNYLVMVTGSGGFSLTVQASKGGQLLSPQLVFAGLQDSSSSQVSLNKSTVTICFL